jgi:protein-disulfide isomerase
MCIRESIAMTARYTTLLVAMFCFAGTALGGPAKTSSDTDVKTVKKQIAAAPSTSSVASVETYEGIPVGFTADGRAFRGNPDASVTLVEYADYVCPFCGRYFQQSLPSLLEKYGRSGQVKFVVDDFPLDSLHPTAPKGAAAATCVAEQGAARFWQMHDALFRRQAEWSRLTDPTNFLAEVARTTGVDMKVYNECVASTRIKSKVEQRVAAAQKLGFTGTPSFQFVQQATGKTYPLVGAQPANVFAAAIDSLLLGKEPPGVEAATKPELPSWAKADGLSPDPKRPGYTIAGDPYKGNPKAKVIMVEFGDFECPACQHHALETQPTLDKKFVDNGEVMWVAKHFPLRTHARAPVASAASECAGDQGRFWSMHDALFARLEQWSAGSAPDSTLRRLAADLQLNTAQFDSCLESRHAFERVLRDLYDGQAIGVRTIPTFILFYGGVGHVFTGARSTDEFVSTLQNQLEIAKSQVTETDALAKR